MRRRGAYASSQAAGGPAKALLGAVGCGDTTRGVTGVFWGLLARCYVLGEFESFPNFQIFTFGRFSENLKIVSPCTLLSSLLIY